MPRIIISITIALLLIFGTLFVKHEVNASNTQKTALIASEINTLNTPEIAAYAKELQAQAVSDASSTDNSTNATYPPVTQNSSAPQGPINATQQLSQDLFTQYMSLKESGIDVSTPVAQQLADNLLSQKYQTGTTTTYTEENLAIETNSVKQDFINYGNALGTTLSAPLPTGAQTEIAIFQTFAQTNDASGLTELTQNITRYTKMRQTLLAMPVPEIFAADHLAVINTLSEIIHDIAIVQTSATDPVGAETALTDYPNAINNLTSAFSDEKALFIQNNVSFSSDDPGYVITK